MHVSIEIKYIIRSIIWNHYYIYVLYMTNLSYCSIIIKSTFLHGTINKYHKLIVTVIRTIKKAMVSDFLDDITNHML